MEELLNTYSFKDQVKLYDINKQNYPFYVFDLEENKIINGFHFKCECKPFILDLIPTDELTKKEIEKAKANYIIILNYIEDIKIF